MGRKVLHTGELGSASVLKVITNYLASVHLVALGEAWTVAKKSNLDLAKKLNTPLEISPKIVEIFKDGQKKYGSRAWSSMIVKRMEDLNKINFRAEGFPDELVDNEPEEKGYEI